MTAKYPAREPFFSHRFCRLMTKAVAAQTIGPEACYLLTVIVHQEDACHYRRGVTWFNSNLAEVAGFNNIPALARARQKAIDAGWLHYEPGGKGVAGKYWVLVPNHVAGLQDSSSDEGDDDLSLIYLNKINATSEREVREKRETNEREAREKRETFNPIPNPIPNPKEIHTHATENEPTAEPLPEAEPEDVYAPYEPDPHAVDWLTVEAEFVRRWNATPGVARCNRGIPSTLAGEFRRKWVDPGWQALFEQALRKFPLKCGSVLSLKNLLDDSTLDRVIGGAYDWQRGVGAAASRNGVSPGPGQRYDPASELGEV